MKQPRNIDKSFKERLGVLRQLDRLQKEGITFAEMDEIGSELQKAGRRAVSPLVRKLWREKSGSLISRYTYLLDFLDDRYWLDQLIQIALKRRDLETEGKAALLNTLEGCGIDVAVPPFVNLLAEVSGPLAVTLPRLLDKGDEGLLWFMEDFVYAPREAQLALLTELPQIGDPRVLTLLQLLFWYDDREVVEQAVTTLGRIRSPEAVAILEEFSTVCDPALSGVVERSLRRLAFLGIASAGMPPHVQQPFHSAYVSPVDGAGYRLLWLARWQEEKRLATIYVQLHDTTGIKSVWGDASLQVEDYEAQCQATVADEQVERVPAEYALELLRDALFTGRQQELQAPPEFYVRRAMFAPAELTPTPYEPRCGAWPVTVTTRLLAAAGQLFDDEFFTGWYLANSQVYDLAEEWTALEKGAAPGLQSAGLERLLERFCREQIQPHIPQIIRRLEFNADLMAMVQRDGELVQLALVVAESLRKSALPGHLHPFLRRFAMESLLAAREALSEGYDLRDHPEDSDDDWE